MTAQQEEQLNKYLAEHCISDCRRNGCVHVDRFLEENEIEE